jgi:uncharacterized membrane protein
MWGDIVTAYFGIRHFAWPCKFHIWRHLIQCGKFVLRARDIGCAILMLISIYLLLNFLNLGRAISKLSSQGHFMLLITGGALDRAFCYSTGYAGQLKNIRPNYPAGYRIFLI